MNSLSGQSLMQHITDSDLDAVTALLSNGDLNLEERDEDGQTFLMIACQLGDFNIVQKLLSEQSSDVNAVDNDNWTALLNGAKKGSANIVSLLLDAEANIEHRDHAGWTALMWACYKGCTDVAKVLLERDANPNVKGEHHMSCLTWAAGRGHTEIVRELLRHGAKVNTADKYGTTPLIWGARKGHCEIVDMLLNEEAVVDKAGMNSWTALIVAAAGGYTDVVRSLLEHHPNVNAVDKDGFTALTLAAKDGFIEIVTLLLQHDAYVNLPDRYGDTILIHAVKGNHLEVVRALLKKYADVDVQGVDNKTALYCAVEKGHMAITKLLLDFSVNTEIPTKDGETPLLRAVRSKNLELVQVLMEKGAKVSATDKHGDNPLHIAVRSRSKRLTEYLLRNPKNSRLLHNKNRSGETPYQIDSTHERSVLTQVFGTRNLNADDNIQGYEMYSSTIADVLSEPTLHTPITVGLFARWGSGKSVLLERLRKEMESFAHLNAEPLFEFSVLQFFLSATFASVIGIPLGIGFTGWGWLYGLCVGCGILILQYALLAIVWYGAKKREWHRSIRVSVYVAKKLLFLKVVLQLVFCNEPTRVNVDISSVRFLFTDSARMTSVVGEKSVTGMIATLCDALENEFGILVPRLYRIFKPQKVSEHGRFKSVCCVPYFVIVLLVVMCAVAALILMTIYGFNSFNDKEYTVINSVLITLGAIVAIAIIGNVYLWWRIIASVAVPLRRYIQKVARRSGSEGLKIDGLMVRLKKEVESIDHMTRCIDAFIGSNHTRLVVVVDGLDSCEQDKLLQVLDMVHVLFGDVDSPFVTLLAVDPHVIIRGIEHNLHSQFHESSINGYDYLRNMVQLPFYIQSQAIPRAVQRNPTRLELNPGDPSSSSVADRNHIVPRQESVMSVMGVSCLSLNDIGRGNSKATTRRQKSSNTGEKGLNGTAGAGTNFSGSTNLVRQMSHFDLSKSLGKSSYFSDINPRSMKRLMNILAVTGRLLRANNVDFNWYKLASWMNITEQWPYRLSWMILEVEDNSSDIDDTQPLRAVYDRVNPKIPSSKDVDPLVEIDRNVRKLEVFLSNSMPPLTVADLKRFLPCTINIDPYLRKLIRELQQNTENMNAEFESRNNSVPNGFDPMDWINHGHGTGMRNVTSSNVLKRSVPTMYPTSNSPRLPATQSGYSQQQKFFPPTMMMHPMMQQMMPQIHPMMQQMYLQQIGMDTLQATVPTNNSKTSPAQAEFKVKVQGGLGNKVLIAMSVDDIARLLGNVEGIDTRRVPDYVARLHDNNITGAVLRTCDLSELKPVMNMSFGDWQLFRCLIETLREHQTTSVSAATSPVVEPGYSELDRRSPASVKFFIHSAGSPDTAPTTIDLASTSSSSPRATSLTTVSPVCDATRKRLSSSDAVATTSSSGSYEQKAFGIVTSSAAPVLHGSFKRPSPLEAAVHAAEAAAAVSSTGGRVEGDEVDNGGEASKGRINRHNSFVAEVMMESEVLRGFIATVAGSDDSDEAGETEDVQRGISPIPEEEFVPLPSSQVLPPEIPRQSSSVSLMRHNVPVSRQVSLESSNAGDRVFLNGPDNDSGESDNEEVERLSRKSSIVTYRSSSARSPKHAARHGDKTSDLLNTSPSRESFQRERKKSIPNVAEKHSGTRIVSGKSGKEKKDGDQSAIPLLSVVPSDVSFSSVLDSQTVSIPIPPRNPHSGPDSFATSSLPGSAASGFYPNYEMGRYYTERNNSWTRSQESLAESTTSGAFQVITPQSSRRSSLASGVSATIGQLGLARVNEDVRLDVGEDEPLLATEAGVTEETRHEGGVVSGVSPRVHVEIVGGNGSQTQCKVTYVSEADGERSSAVDL